MRVNIVQFPSKTLQQYFAQSDTPAADSPVGVAMQRLLKKNPRLTFAEARVQAGGLSAEDTAKLSGTSSAWTEGEQDAFAQVMQAGRLYRRCGSNLEKALRVATGYNPLSAVQTAASVRTKAARVAATGQGASEARFNGADSTVRKQYGAICGDVST
jgi:hypothetical protein